MANIINASNGIIQTADSSSDLNIQTGGATAIAIDSSQNVVIAKIADNSGSLRNIPSAGAAKTAAYTLTISDIGEFVTVGASGSITVPNDTFATGNAISIFNNTSGTISIDCPITTAYLAGTDADRASLTLATRGVATILFINPSLCVASGNLT